MTAQEERLAEIRGRIEPGFLPTIDVGPGWYDLVIDLDTQIREIDPGYTIAQIKEKFGGLRFYLGTEPAHADQVNALLEAAERKASQTCEECGQPGSLRNAGWLKTLCDLHDQQWRAQRRQRWSR
jgi:hypothetical protein